MGTTSFFNQQPHPLVDKLSTRIILQKPASSVPRCGLYIINPDIIQVFPQVQLALPLLNIDYKIEVINHLAKVLLTQTYQNSSEVFLETEYSFPIDPKIVIHQFRAKFDNVVIAGEVKEKEQAKEEYKQAVAQGRQAAYGEIDEDSYDIMNLKVGNIPPKTKVTIEIQFIQELAVEMNTLYKLRIPSVITPRYVNEAKDKNWEKQFEKFLSPHQIKATYTWSFNLKLLSESPLTFNNSPTHQLLQTSVNPAKTEADFILSENQIPNKDFVFVYSNEKMASCTVGKNDISVCAAISFIPKYAELKADDAFQMMLKDEKYQTDIETACGEYIFVLDRSGSMSGSRITKAIEALKIFLKSLPTKTVFNIISFGSHYECMFPQSVEYNDSNIKTALSRLSGFSANFGGTEIKSSLQYIFNKPTIKDHPRQIFLLTDGGVSDTNVVIKLVKDNVKYSRVHTIGVGNGCSTALIKGCAEKGKGKAVFITDEGDIASPVIELLSASLTPIVTQFQLVYDTSIVESITPNPNSMPFILKDEPVNFYVIFKEGFLGKTIFNLKYTESVHNAPYEIPVIVDTSNDHLNFPFVDKIAQHKTISVMVDKIKDKQLLDQDLLIAKIDDLEKEIVRRSVKSQVLCPLTAFICVGKKLEDGKYIEFMSKGKESVVIPQHTSVDYEAPQPYGGQLFAGSMPGARMASMALKAPMAHMSPMSSISSMMPSYSSSPMDSMSMPQMFSMPKAIIDPVPRNIRFGSTKQSSTSPSKAMFSEQSDRFFAQPPPAKQMDRKQELNNLFGMGPSNDRGLQSLKKSKQKKVEQYQQEQLQCAMISKKSKPRQQKQKQQRMIVEDHNQGPLLEYIISNQSINGSWQASHDFLSRVLKSVMKQFKEVADQYVVSPSLVLTIVIAAWLSANHNTPAYSLIIKKARTWINKQIAQTKLDQKAQVDIISRLPIS